MLSVTSYLDFEHIDKNIQGKFFLIKTGFS